MSITAARGTRAWAGGIWASALLVGVALAIAGCAPAGGASTGGASSGGGTPSVATATATAAASGPGPTATPAPAPPHVFAWYQYDSHATPQVWASVNGGSPHQITHVAPPPADGCDTEVAWSPPVFSPDLTHIAAALGSYNCGDGDLEGPASVLSASSGAISVVPGNHNIRLTERTAGWLDASNIWFVSTGNIYTYHLGAASATQLPGISGAVEGAVRGSTLFWDSVDTSSASSWSYTLHRYDLGVHSALAGSISLGAWGTCACSPGDLHTPGWDASPDGSHVVYQLITAHIAPSGGIASSRIYYSHADGSGASQIAHYMVTDSMVKLQISPDGQWVAFTNALPSPATLTASVSTPGGAGDSTFHGYTPDTYNYPVWKWDSTQFWAGKVDVANADPGASTGSLYRFNRGGSSSVGVAGGYNPWYTIGS
jgi:hypothetical protein